MKPKLRTFVTFKHNFDSEDYVKYCYSHHKRSLLAQFRNNVLPFSIGTGRFRNIPLEERLCVLCDLNVTEDEKHFLCTCNLYDDRRQTLYHNIRQRYEHISILNVDEKFQYIVINEWKELGVYLQYACERRNSILFEYFGKMFKSLTNFYVCSTYYQQGHIVICKTCFLFRVTDRPWVPFYVLLAKYTRFAGI